MQPRVPCEFFLVRYVPDVVKGEFVNIGVLLREATDGGDAATPMRVRFTRDWARVRCMDASADVGLLEDLEQEIARYLSQGSGGQEPAALLAVLEASLSNSIQMTEPRAALAENLTTELEQLMRLYVEPIAPAARPKPGRKNTGRPALQAAMRSHFERAGVWQRMNKRIAAERYTRPGDPLKLDCGYRGDARTLHIFHAVSLDSDLETAKVLAYMAPQLHEGVRRVEEAALELTAVVEPFGVLAADDGEPRERYHFGVETMVQQKIRVITTHDLERASMTARHELGL